MFAPPDGNVMAHINEKAHMEDENEPNDLIEEHPIPQGRIKRNRVKPKWTRDYETTLK